MTSSRMTVAGLALGLLVATAGTASAQGTQGGASPGMMERQGSSDMMGGAQGGMAQGGTGQDGAGQGSAGQGMMGGGMMGRGMRAGGMGRGMMGEGTGRETNCGMMQGGMRRGMMGRGMMGSGMMGSGTAGGMETLFGTRVRPVMNLSVDDVRNYLAFRLDRLGNKRLKVGNVNAEGDTITAEIVTVDNSLVQRMKIDRHTARINYED